MKIKKIYSFSDKKQIWRLLLSDSDKLIIETRDTDKKEVYFHCLDLFSGKKIFKNFQPDEKYWVSIEGIHDDVIFFHKYAKPDMPGHRFIQAYDINTKSVLWESDKYIFMFIDKKGLYCYEKNIAGNQYYILNYRTGEIIDKPEIDEAGIIELNHLASETKDYSNYLFPEKYFLTSTPDISRKVADLIQPDINLLEIVGPVEYVVKEETVFFNFHYRQENKICNKLIIKESDSGKKLYDEIINKEVNAYAPDSFFIYKDLLLYLSEKKEVFVCKLSD